MHALNLIKFSPLQLMILLYTFNTFLLFEKFHLVLLILCKSIFFISFRFYHLFLLPRRGISRNGRVLPCNLIDMYLHLVGVDSIKRGAPFKRCFPLRCVRRNARTERNCAPIRSPWREGKQIESGEFIRNDTY